MFFSKRAFRPGEETSVDAAVRLALPETDADTQRIVTAIVGLSGVVAYADRNFSDAERAALVRLLGTIHGLDEAKASALVTALEQQIVHVSATEMARHARTLIDLADRDLRHAVLEMLLDLAASDANLAQEEVVVLRQVTKALGLDQADYNRLQERHRAVLAALK